MGRGRKSADFRPRSQPNQGPRVTRGVLHQLGGPANSFAQQLDQPPGRYPSTSALAMSIEVKPAFRMYRQETLIKSLAALSYFAARGFGYLLIDASGRTLVTHPRNLSATARPIAVRRDWRLSPGHVGTVELAADDEAYRLKPLQGDLRGRAELGQCGKLPLHGL